MDDWKRRVNEALDALQAAQLEEQPVREQLEVAENVDPEQVPPALKRLWFEKSQAITVARARVEAVLWE